ncbi:asparaginase domain-containing protein [Wenyingzhuangia sp. 2_MG-2023]|uniref:asparaginase domain-containing protein n=1 Tax=Wenyingzhuangia sp. 2_MG-2023 TaxID=3062639 RepID=UPI0026E3C1B1|nr:asparaginase domain-containing protein [Wenyingzhuangia sp. 2_MG-2023]MDO6738180.1 asparaginase domain-containing protein [Wenyingzhuangia sp. 2_MG-2023]
MKILVIYTGGTIGMVKDEVNESLKPAGVEPIKEYVTGQLDLKNIDFKSTKEPIDSCNFGMEYYFELATIVEQNYSNYDSFLILMGTDTMAYVSSLLSYCISGLDKSIVFTGGQLPLMEDNSDSKLNLKGALLGMLQDEFPKEVGLYFNEKWFRAVEVTKVDSQNNDAYMVPNSGNLMVDFSQDSFHIEKKIESKIVVFKLNPFYNNDLLKLVLASDSITGLVLEAFGMGNFPDFDKELQQLFVDKISKGLKVVIVTQCLRGGVVMGKYEASLESEKLGFISGGALTTESAIAKMMYLSTKKLNIQEYQSFFRESLRGES